MAVYTHAAAYKPGHEDTARALLEDWASRFIRSKESIGKKLIAREWHHHQYDDSKARDHLPEGLDWPLPLKAIALELRFD